MDYEAKEQLLKQFADWMNDNDIVICEHQREAVEIDYAEYGVYSFTGRPIECPECGWIEHADKDDYICVNCRLNQNLKGLEYDKDGNPITWGVHTTHTRGTVRHRIVASALVPKTEPEHLMVSIDTLVSAFIFHTENSEPFLEHEICSYEDALEELKEKQKWTLKYEKSRATVEE